MENVWTECPRCHSKNISSLIKTAKLGEFPEARIVNRCGDCGRTRSVVDSSWEVKRIINDELEGYFSI